MVIKIVKNERLQEVINKNGLKQNWIAEKTGIDAATFSKILNGIHNPSLEQVQKIAEVLGVDVNDIF